ncbi:hypothetical protein ACLOJK_011423 [Asimina triloba]
MVSGDDRFRISSLKSVKKLLRARLLSLPESAVKPINGRITVVLEDTKKLASQSMETMVGLYFANGEQGKASILAEFSEQLGDASSNVLNIHLKDMMEPDSFYAVKPEHKDDVPKSRFKPKPGKTLSTRRWHAAFSQEGYLDMAKVLSRIQRGVGFSNFQDFLSPQLYFRDIEQQYLMLEVEASHAMAWKAIYPRIGVHPSIKGVVWEFLLGCYSPNSTFDQRTDLRQKRRDQYAAWKAECQAMEPTIGSGRILTTPVITEDGHPIQDPSVKNDDLPDSMSSSMDPPLDKKQILEHYYVGMRDSNSWTMSGMNDLCSPMIVLFENEADAFWCFERLMRRMHGSLPPYRPLSIPTTRRVYLPVKSGFDVRHHTHLYTWTIPNMSGSITTDCHIVYIPHNHIHVTYMSATQSCHVGNLMWGMEYNPNIFILYEEERNQTPDPSTVTRVNDKVLKHYGKFERKNLRSGSKDPQTALSIFLIASVLENRNKRLMKEAKGLDDVVKILNEITGNLDAKKACNEALKLHKKYMSKASLLPSNDELRYFSIIDELDN